MRDVDEGAGSAGSPVVERMTFGEIDIDYDGSVLVPRPWTLAQSTWAHQLLDIAPEGRVLELCSGAGHIGLAAVHGTERRIVQVDRDEGACAFARGNASAAGIDADVRCGSMTEVLDDDERFALVIADPPWVPSAGIGVFPEDPVWAIDGGDDGLDVARTCVQVAANHLERDGLVLLQLGSAEQVTRLDDTVQRCGLATAEVRSFSGGAVALLRPH